MRAADAVVGVHAEAVHPGRKDPVELRYCVVGGGGPALGLPGVICAGKRRRQSVILHENTRFTLHFTCESWATVMPRGCRGFNR